MTDFKLGTEVVQHHGKQTQPQAIANFLSELNDFKKLISTDDGTTQKNLAQFNMKQLDKELHKGQNGIAPELNEHLHASAVYKIDGKMQLVFTDDLYNKNDKNAVQHAYTINEKTGKIDAVFDIAHSKTGEKVLIRHKEKGEAQTHLAATKNGQTSVLQGDNYTEYQTPDHRVIKQTRDTTVVHNPNGPTETYVTDKGQVIHNVRNEHGKFEQQGGAYKSVKVSEDGTITADRTTGDFSVTTYPDGHRVERNGTEGGGDIIRIKSTNGAEFRFTWGDDKSNPQSVMIQSKEKDQFEATRAPGFYGEDVYQSTGGLYWKIHVDKEFGTVNYKQITQRDLDRARMITPAPAPAPEFSHYA